ncbi:transcriptional regulator CynR [Nocardia sp. NPDC005978]|uniref:transcriptional regulator CynR n=1 Tax=Nocardia sp. NPDC005978 TaxID=3156725 RepID=UPI0033A5C6E7
MAPEIRHLRYLLAVAEHGNFTRAATDLHLSQPTLSQQVRQLERMVGTPLLDRSGRAVRLTDAGELYARHARAALSELDAAERAVRDVEDLTRGHLRVAVTPSFTAYLLGPIVAEMRERYPGVSVDIRETSQDAIESALLADDLDLGIAFAGTHLPGIDAEPLFAESLNLVLSRTSNTPASVPVAALSGFDLALLNADFATRAHIDTYLREHAVTPSISVEANSIQAVIEIVTRTTLATVLPDAITREHPDLTAVPLDPPLPTRTAVLLHRAGAYRSAAARAFHRLTALRRPAIDPTSQ